MVQNGSDFWAITSAASLLSTASEPDLLFCSNTLDSRWSSSKYLSAGTTTRPWHNQLVRPACFFTSEHFQICSQKSDTDADETVCVVRATGWLTYHWRIHRIPCVAKVEVRNGTLESIESGKNSLKPENHWELRPPQAALFPTCCDLRRETNTPIIRNTFECVRFVCFLSCFRELASEKRLLTEAADYSHMCWKCPYLAMGRNPLKHSYIQMVIQNFTKI